MGDAMTFKPKQDQHPAHNIQVLVGADLYEQIKLAAERANLSIAAFMREAVRFALEHMETE